MTVVDARATVRRRFAVTGVVQGVGFRPFVCVLATDSALTGFVGNDTSGVFIEVEGASVAVDQFARRLAAESPPAARIESVVHTSVPVVGSTDFVIVASVEQHTGTALVSPDLATCIDCATELEDPHDRRYRYPFINCTNCGPRFTITHATPYDRPQTTMAGFTMCERCLAEYGDPSDRRFHAQPNACADCGPEVWFEDAGGRTPREAVSAARDLIAQGGVVAIKGLGGFHLACDASSEPAIDQLRERKGRVDKPFAVMVRDLETAQSIADLDDDEETLLLSVPRPIVLVTKKPHSRLSHLVAPGNRRVGVMLAYTPLHRLLLEPGDVWVMTSGNRSQEPIAHDNDEARCRLTDLADAFIMHDRDIVVPVDDSVIQVLDGSEMPVRRSRGYAPFPVTLPESVPPLLATGGELKATFCLASGTHGFMSQHIGDMENLETLDAFTAAFDHMRDLFRIEPEIIATDLHPGYLSARWADRIADGRPVVRVQHHHAHVASLMAEHGSTTPIIGFSFDGTGYGTDGTVWGGEVLIASYERFERVAHLATVLLPGGDTTVRRPYRMAMSHLWAAGMPWDTDLAPVAAASAQELAVLASQLERGFNVVPTSSMGRLFDAVSALTGVCQKITYEAQAAIELESIADSSDDAHYAFDIGDSVIDPSPVLRSVVDDVRCGVPAGIVAMRFHRAVADVVHQLSVVLREREGIGTIGLSGGVFQNMTLTGLVQRRLESGGFRVLTHRLVPPNDGGIALGQAMVAAAKVR